MSKRKRATVAESEHIQSLKRQITRLETMTHTGVASLVHDFPELADLMHTISDLTFLADPRKGQTTDGDGRLSARPKDEGESTRKYRERLKYWRRRTADQVKAMQTDMDPEAVHAKDVRPRCGKRDCDGRGRRQPVGSNYCSFCREPLKHSDTTKSTHQP